MTPTEKRHLAYILLLALGLRLYVTLFTPVIGTDGYFFVKNSQLYYAGQFLEGLREAHHPLYPMLIALFNVAVGDFETAGKLVSLVFGTLTIIPLYFLTRSIFSHRVAIFAAFFIAMNAAHVRHSADIMTESTYIFFFVTGVWLSWEMLRSTSTILPVLAAISSVLAYYTRPEGLGICLVVIPWAFVVGFWEKKDLRPVYNAFIFTLVTVILVLPYILFVHKETGIWHITKKGSAREIAGYEIVPKPSGEKSIDIKYKKSDAERLYDWKEKGNYPMIGLYIVGEFIKVCYYPFVPFLLLGFFTIRQGREGPQSILKYILSIRMALSSSHPAGEFFVISIFFLYFAVLFMLAVSSYYTSGRYLLPLVALSAMWIGAGLERTTQYLSKVTSQSFNMSPDRATVVLLLVLGVLTLPKAAKIKRQNEVMQKEAGHWLKHQTDKKPPIIMGLQKVAFYADCSYVPLPDGGYDALVKIARESEIDYLFVYSEETDTNVLQSLDDNKDFLPVKEWTERKNARHLRAYKLNAR